MPPSDNDSAKKPGGPAKPRDDGPIIDLKAKRVDEPAAVKPGDKSAAAGAAKPGEAKPGEAKPGETKPADPNPASAVPGKASDAAASGAKPADVKPAEAVAPKPSPGSATPASGASMAKPVGTAPEPAKVVPAAGPAVAKTSEPPKPAALDAKPDAKASPGAAPATAASSLGKGPVGATPPGAVKEAAKDSAKPGNATGPTTRPAGAGVPPAQTNTSAAKPGRAGLGAVAAAGLVGGVIGAGLLYGVEHFAPATGSGDAEARIAALESRLGALNGLNDRVAAAEARLGPLADAARSAGEEAKAARELAARQPAAQNAPAAPAVDPARLDALARRVDGIEAATKALPSAETVRGAEQRVAALEEQGRARAGALTALEGRVATAADAAAANGRRLDEQAALGSQIGGRVEALSRDVAGRAEASRLQAGLRVVAADRIATALALGQPYADALGTLKGLGGQDAGGNVALLEAYAAGGAPTAQDLARQFRPLAERIGEAQREATQRGVAATGSITDRLASMAGSIVQVRRVGDAPAVAGPNPLSQVQAALDRGDLAAAAKAWDGLPDAARAASAEFGASLKRRAAAGEAAAAVAGSALAQLSAPR